jgi:twitching motility protein PilT
MSLHELLSIAKNFKASDIHLAANQFPAMRIDGEIYFHKMLNPFDSLKIKNIFYEFMSETQQIQFEKYLEIDFVLSTGMERCRVNLFHQINGLSAALRLIPNTIPKIEDFPEIFKKIALINKGLVLITGPTGSGKSTTLAALMDYINQQQAKHIVTIEDPIEFIHHNKLSLINQREIHQHTRSFSSGLRAALREDPDIILLGEMRDLETIQLALTAAETGHLVIATLHTNSAASTIHRVIDVFPSTDRSYIRNLLAESLQAVISQQLIRRVTGGRTAAFEILLCTHAIRNLIREDKISHIYSALQTNHSLGMRTLDQSLLELVQNNQITCAQAHIIAHNKELF